MAISLPPDLEQFVQRLLSSGQYLSVDEIVADALTLLEEREHVRGLRRARLLQELADGVFQADNRHLIDADEVFRGLGVQASDSVA